MSATDAEIDDACDGRAPHRAKRLYCDYVAICFVIDCNQRGFAPSLAAVRHELVGAGALAGAGELAGLHIGLKSAARFLRRWGARDL